MPQAVSPKTSSQRFIPWFTSANPCPEKSNDTQNWFGTWFQQTVSRNLTKALDGKYPFSYFCWENESLKLSSSKTPRTVHIPPEPPRTFHHFGNLRNSEPGTQCVNLPNRPGPPQATPELIVCRDPQSVPQLENNVAISTAALQHANARSRL